MSLKKNLTIMSLAIFIFIGCKKDQSTLSNKDSAQTVLKEIMANIPKSFHIDYRDSISIITYKDGRVVKKQLSKSRELSSINATGETEIAKSISSDVTLVQNPATVSCFANPLVFTSVQY